MTRILVVDDEAFSRRAITQALEKAKLRSTVVEDPNAAPPPNQPDNPPTQELDVYKKAGSGFAGIGIGVFLPIAAGHGPTLELGLMRLFPSNGTALALSLGYALGV